VNDEQLRSVILQWVKGHTIQRHVTISGSYREELMADHETADEFLGLFHRRQFEETLAILSALDYINAHGCADDGRSPQPHRTDTGHHHTAAKDTETSPGTAAVSAR